MKISQLNTMENGKDTLEQSRVFLQENAKKGVKCPCCSQKVKLYKRTLSPVMCLALINIYKFYKHNENADIDEFYTKDDFFFDSETWMYADFQKLYYFDCIAPKFTSTKDVKRKKGYWQITDIGIKFVQREIGLPNFCYVFNNEVEEHSTQFSTIEQILQSVGWEYDNLMKIITTEENA